MCCAGTMRVIWFYAAALVQTTTSNKQVQILSAWHVRSACTVRERERGRAPYFFLFFFV